MLLVKRIPAGEAVILGRISDARCERCAWPDWQGRQLLVPAIVVLEQVWNPDIAFVKIIGCCELHYPPSLAKLYVEHGWKIVWRTPGWRRKS